MEIRKTHIAWLVRQRLAERSRQEFGRMLVRDEAARWSCRADELEEFFHGVADQLLQLMKAIL